MRAGRRLDPRDKVTGSWTRGVAPNLCLQAPGRTPSGLGAGSLCVSGGALLPASSRRGTHTRPSPGPARGSSRLTGLPVPSSYVWDFRPAQVSREACRWPTQCPDGRPGVPLCALSHPGVSGSGDGCAPSHRLRAVGCTLSLPIPGSRPLPCLAHLRPPLSPRCPGLTSVSGE